MASWSLVSAAVVVQIASQQKRREKESMWGRKYLKNMIVTIRNQNIFWDDRNITATLLCCLHSTLPNRITLENAVSD